MDHVDIERLADDLARLESLRAAKDVQRRYAHLSHLRRWDDVAALFAPDGEIVFGDEILRGKSAITTWLRAQPGAVGGPGSFRTELIDAPVAHLSSDGTGVAIRWSSLAFCADGLGGTWIGGGVYENSYRQFGDGWRIARQHYFPQFAGDHADGWTNIGGEDLPIVPFHFTADEAGVPLPSTARLAQQSSPIDLAGRIGALVAEDAVRNLVHALGYYVDRRMWDDVVDLFTEDARVELTGVRALRGPDGVRAAMLEMGPDGLEDGHLNDRPLFDTMVRVHDDERASTRSIELGMLGDSDKGEAAWEITIVTTHCIKVGGLWRISELCRKRRMYADYFRGWGQAELWADAEPGSADPLAAHVRERDQASRGTANDSGDPSALRTQLNRALAFDGVENVSSAYGYYIDDFRWTETATLFASAGNKQSPFAGYYLGRDRIQGATTAMWGPPPELRPGISFHWRTQPVISISADGRSAHLRVRLFQPRTWKYPSRPGEFYAAGFHGGMYPNDQAVLEDGTWRLWSLTIDEPYFTSLDWKGGWASVPPARDQPAPRPSPLLEKYPPDIPMTALGRREEHFRGGTGELVQWPGILPMWFHYRNPVSGRRPERFWPDCVPSEVLPSSRMTEHGYQMPPNGPEIDGREVDPGR